MIKITPSPFPYPFRNKPSCETFHCTFFSDNETQTKRTEKSIISTFSFAFFSSLNQREKNVKFLIEFSTLMNARVIQIGGGNLNLFSTTRGD